MSVASAIEALVDIGENYLAIRIGEMHFAPFQTCSLVLALACDWPIGADWPFLAVLTEVMREPYPVAAAEIIRQELGASESHPDCLRRSASDADLWHSPVWTSIVTGHEVRPPSVGPPGSKQSPPAASFNLGV